MWFEGRGRSFTPPAPHPIKSGGCPYEDVGIPDGRHAVGRDRLDLHPRLAVRAAVLDRLHSLTLLEREKNGRYSLPLILERKIAHQRDEKVELGVRVLDVWSL